MRGTPTATAAQSSIKGPAYVPNAPDLGPSGTLPMRHHERGTTLDR
jgi:hypothetical protein